MCKSLVTNPWHCLLSRIELVCACQDSLDQRFWLGALFDAQFNKLVKLLGSIVVIIWTQNEHKNICLQSPEVK